MIKVSHETPLCLLEDSKHFNDYDYCLPHLLDEEKGYEEYFRQVKKEGRYIIMDNSLHELGEAYNNERLMYWINELEPDEFIVPDVWENRDQSVINAKEWSQIILPKNTTKVAVVQATTIHEASTCYQTYKDLGYKKIAFSYKGRRTHIYDLSRSIEIHTFSKLFQKPNCQFFLVDKDIGKDDEKFLKQFKNVVNCDSLINDWHDTVTILSKLDEIITVDTSLGHIGGVMNHPTRILVNKNCDWRWGMPEDGEKTPWYSSIKIIRQKESDNWEQLLMGLVNEKQK